jgi:hypothetical protein
VAEANKKADEMIEAANVEAENIKLRTKKALEEIDAVLTEQKNNAQAQVDIMLEEAARKSEGMILAAKDSVTREQLLFDKLKSEVAQFKSQIKETYKEHLESLSKLPDEVTLNPELAASTIEDIINNEPDLLKFIEKTTIEPEEEVATIEEPQAEEEIEAEVEETEATAEEATIVLDPIVLPETQEKPASGFVVMAMEDDKDDDDEAPAFTKGFFTKHK